MLHQNSKFQVPSEKQDWTEENKRRQWKHHQFRSPQDSIQTLPKRQDWRSSPTSQTKSEPTREAKVNSATVEGHDGITPEQLATIVDYLNEDSSDDNDYDDVFVGQWRKIGNVPRNIGLRGGEKIEKKGWFFLICWGIPMCLESQTLMKHLFVPSKMCHTGLD